MSGQQHSQHDDRDALGAAVTKAVVPAYLLPAAQAFAVGHLTGDPALATAAYTTIAVPSAVAAAVVTVACRLLDRRRRQRTVRAAWAALTGAAAGAVLAAGPATVLVANGVFGTALLTQAVPSAAVGGAITALTWAVRRNRQARRYSAGGRGAEPSSVVRRDAGVPASAVGVR